MKFYSKSFFHENLFEIVVCEMVANLSQPQCVKPFMLHYSRTSDQYSIIKHDYTQEFNYTEGIRRHGRNGTDVIVTRTPLIWPAISW